MEFIGVCIPADDNEIWLCSSSASAEGVFDVSASENLRVIGQLFLQCRYATPSLVHRHLLENLLS